MKKYIPQDIEAKWQKRWEDEGLYKFKPGSKQENYYSLVELPYTSGDLHLGHWFAFTPPDAYARFKRMRGYRSFFPMGFDAFGLPAENAAIKRGIHPKEWTFSNIETMTRQFKTMGTSLAWDHEVITCDPKYYRWNQWIFIKMFERGIAYRGKAISNWCPIDQTVLADENVVDGKCWRDGAEVVKKEVDQWFLKITEYADRLVWPEKPDVDWPISVRVGQNVWIGKSEGKLLKFPVILNDSEGSQDSSRDSSQARNDNSITVFTTRPETTDGASFVVLAPEHPKVKELTTKEQKAAVENYVRRAKAKTELERKENREKSGVFSGIYVANPVTGEKIPVWVADYVLLSYGTGAIMAVPFADVRDKEFAKRFNLPIPKTNLKANPRGEKKVNYHLHDWSISRQRYWGTPVPIIHCEKCGMVPVPEKYLPVELPYDVDFTPKGKPPLATNEKWLNVVCPKCGGKAKRDAETLDGFFDNSWYFYRYLDPDFEKGPFDPELAKKMTPINIYFGGAEHTLGHTLYARFFTKFFNDLGLLDYGEFALKRIQHGVVLGPDGARMSKSHGNVVNPDDLVKEYGADTVRLYLCFMMPYIETTAPFSPGAIEGIYRFLRRVWELNDKVIPDVILGTSETRTPESGKEKDSGQARMNMMHKTIKKVTEDFENIKFNTAIAALMEWLNFLSQKSISHNEYETFILLLAPFAPHISEELWQNLLRSNIGYRQSEGKNDKRQPIIDKQTWSVHQQPWPKLDEKYLVESQVSIVVQVNGKLRDVLQISSESANNQDELEKIALASQKIKKHLDGKSPKKIIYVKKKILSIVV